MPRSEISRSSTYDGRSTSICQRTNTAAHAAKKVPGHHGISPQKAANSPTTASKTDSQNASPSPFDTYRIPPPNTRTAQAARCWVLPRLSSRFYPNLHLHSQMLRDREDVLVAAAAHVHDQEVVLR